MLQFLDLDRTLLTVSPGCVSPIATATVPRGAGEILRVQLLSAPGIPTELPGTAECIWIAKAQGDYSGEALVLADDFDYDAVNQRYEAIVNYSGDGLDALLGTAAYVVLDAQFAYRLTSDDEWQRSQVINLVVHNSVWRSLDSAPDIAPVPWEWLKDSIAVTAPITQSYNESTKVITLALGGYVITGVDADPSFYTVSLNGVANGRIPRVALP